VVPPIQEHRWSLALDLRATKTVPRVSLTIIKVYDNATAETLHAITCQAPENRRKKKEHDALSLCTLWTFA